MPQHLKVGIAKQGKLICPLCSQSITIPEDRWLGRGLARCSSNHDFVITDEVALAINESLSKTRAGNFRKDMLKNGFEETPKQIRDREVSDGAGGKIILPP